MRQFFFGVGSVIFIIDACLCFFARSAMRQRDSTEWGLGRGENFVVDAVARLDMGVVWELYWTPPPPLPYSPISTLYKLYYIPPPLAAAR